MTWMNLAAGGFPLYLDHARGARVTDIDGHEYVDFALGDTGAMAGHSPPARSRRPSPAEHETGITTMMPTEDAAWVGEELARRFGLPQWSFTLTATDANRWAIRIARHVTRRPEDPRQRLVLPRQRRRGVRAASDPTGDGRRAAGERRRAGRARRAPRGSPSSTTSSSSQRELAHEDVAVVLMEPALTNIGIVLPEPGYLESVRRLTREHGTLLIDDETHTFSAGPGGATARLGARAGHRHDRQGDRRRHPRRVRSGYPPSWRSGSPATRRPTSYDTGGVGGTLAGNALSLGRHAGDARARPHRRRVRAA